MRKLLILADDLSGAADSANACISSGLRAVVSFNDGYHSFDGEVLSIDCDTRHLSSAESASRIMRIMRNPHLRLSERVLFKKVDSTLRGNIASELRAVLDERRATSTNRVVAIMAPAFPATGRTTIDGFQLLHGISLEKTEIWNHSNLAGVAHIPTMLRDAGLSSAHLPLSMVRGNVTNIHAAMLQLAVQYDVIVCDAETQEDLDAIARASFSLGSDNVWVGSAGLAYQLPGAIGWPSSSTFIQQPEFIGGPSLFVVGSMSSTSHRQARALEDAISVTSIRIPPNVLLKGPAHYAWQTFIDRVDASLKSGDDTLVAIAPEERPSHHEHRHLTAALGRILAPASSLIGSLFVTGGETARAILEGWGIDSLYMLGELEPGLPFSCANSKDRYFPVLTKAGAFGSQDTLVSCWQFFARLVHKPHLIDPRNNS